MSAPAAPCARALVAALAPDLLPLLVVLDVVQARVRGRDGERGDAIQWVVITALGAAIALTVGTILLSKLTGKAKSIDLSTPGAGH